MIPEVYIREWGQHVSWREIVQIEHDLVLSRALVALYNTDLIANTLVFRGGTALNKFYLKPPARYSEDLDFVQLKPAPIGDTIDVLKEVLSPWLGKPKWKSTERSIKMVFRYQSSDLMPIRLKIEINTTEHFKVKPLQTIPFQVINGWYEGKANVSLYSLEELIATKVRALHQRRKVRDLFDIWYVANHLNIDFQDVALILKQYCNNDGITISQADFINTLSKKREHHDFRNDMAALLPRDQGWHFDEAYRFVIEEVIPCLH